MNKIQYFIPVEELDVNAKAQVEETANLEFVEGVAVMPDAHLGKGSCVGSVIATKNAIIPAAVGVDIGCGMIAVRTSLKAEQLKFLHKLRRGIERRIPLSAGHFNKEMTPTAQLRAEILRKGELPYYHEVTRVPWEEQLGSLGSGNHFIEVCLDEKQRVWVVLHSGSRGIGNKLAEKHIKIAQELHERAGDLPTNKDLAWLTESQGTEFDAYIRDLLWAQNFARLNRDEMMDRVMKELSYHLFGEDGHQTDLERERINCHHNFTQQEKHHRQKLWITRKGAIQMEVSQMGIIPGSMGTATYIVEGLGNRQSYNSAPHGAGRRFSRAEARRRFTMEDFDRELKGIEVNRSEEFIDEIPSAYKDIESVMKHAKPLVEVVHTLKQVLNIKGD